LGRLIKEKIMKTGVFCSRKGGCRIKGAFHRHPRTSEILAKEIERNCIKMEARKKRRDEKQQSVVR
jgi:hypothetical protein